MPSKTTQKSSSESSPWKPAQTGLTDVIAKAQSLGGNTGLFTPVQGTTTNQAFDLTKQIANAGSAALDPLQQVVGGSTQGFGTGIEQLMATARGDNLSNVAPELQAALARASRDTANSVNQQFAGSGRYGSANHAGVIADRVGGIQTNALVDNYNRERANQLTAANTLNSGGYAGAGLAGEIDKARLFTPEMLGQIGAKEDAFALAQKQAPLNAAKYQADMLLPIASLGGQQSSYSKSKTSDPVGTAVGIGMTGLGMMAGLPPGLMGGLGGLTGPTGGSGGFMSF